MIKEIKLILILAILLTLSCSFPKLPDENLSGMHGHIYFDSNRTGNYDIYVMNADGTGIVNLTQTDEFDEIMPSVSHNDSILVFMKAPHYDFEGYELWSMKSDGTELIQLTDNMKAEGHSDFAPDNRRIVYVSWRDGNEEIYIMDISTGIERRITFNEASDNDPDWSPDGKTIAFKSTRAYTDSSFAEFLDARYEIFTMDTMGENIIQLSSDNLSDHDPDYSPDGMHIAFLRVFDDGTNDVCIMNADGSEQKKLTESGNNWYTAFSPDGNNIAFCSSRDESVDIYIMNADGSDEKRVTCGMFTDEFPAWR